MWEQMGDAKAMVTPSSAHSQPNLSFLQGLTAQTLLACNFQDTAWNRLLFGPDMIWWHAHQHDKLRGCVRQMSWS
jgi:hypothetical protein